MKKKIMVGFVTVLFCLLLVAPSNGSSERAVTFVKHMPDGRIETFQHNVTLLKGETVSESISRTCAELLTEDRELRHYADSGTGLFFIVSGGPGMHMALPPSGKYSWFLEMYWALVPSIIYCHYDAGAHSDITPLTGGDNVNLEDSHRILCVGFVGILGWSRTFSFDDTGLAGFTPYLWYSQD
ncbi:MAG TPA: hypothetical protein ENG06_01010 [Thermoplasmatales archaeon]|nr:MAG: hypothetical protein FE046_00140 [Thermoplasmata archaeon]RLF32449.1 MAG: hypothetical protein DRN07_05010 [Thermoplasmata archaeon]HDN50336.1 hypothetical protein [Thermoplasmatales archaeon]